MTEGRNREQVNAEAEARLEAMKKEYMVLRVQEQELERAENAGIISEEDQARLDSIREKITDLTIDSATLQREAGLPYKFFVEIPKED